KLILVQSKNTKTNSEIVSQQQNPISGKVTDDTGEPLPGVTVLIKGTTQGTVTDMDGNYTITNVPDGAILQFSFVGMLTQEIEVGNQTSINITLLVDAIGIEEVVAIGYGVVKKSDLTGAVASVKADQLEKIGASSVGQAIAGKAAGLTVVNNSAQPGGGISWQIRGSATGRSPLIIVDGFPITGKGEAGSGNRYNSGSKATTLNTINPNDIESIEILKDASATSIYGSRAAGGVIIISTKRGAKGQAVVEYSGSYSVQNLYNLPEMLGPKDFMSQRNEVIKEVWMRDNGVAPYGDKTWDEVENNYPGNKYTDQEINNFAGGTNWLEKVTRPGSISQHDISMTGGRDKTKYLLSLSTFQQDGIVKTNAFNRYSGRLNLDQELASWLKVGISTAFTLIKEDNVPLGGGRNEHSGVIRSSLQFNPLLPVKDDLGIYVLDPDQSFIPNPVSLLESDDQTNNEDLLINSYIEARPVTGLLLKLTAGINKNMSLRNTYVPTTTLYGDRVGGQASKSMGLKSDLLLNFISQYSRTIAEKHDLSIMGGYEYQKFYWEGFNAGNTQFPYDGVKYHNLALGEKEKPDVGSYGGSSELASFFSRFNYTYNGKYLLTVNLRVDGSSNFAENHQWGVFPGVSVAWRINEEDFLTDNDWLSNLKLRAGYGQTGNDNLSGVLTYYTPGWNYGFGSVSRSGIGLANIGNPNLKWETQTDLNLGLDFGFFNNNISGSIEVYDRVITDLLGNKPLLSYHAINSIRSNLDAEKQTRGVDFQLSTMNINRGGLKWTTDFTLTYYQDRWRKRDASWKPDINDEEQAVWGTWWTYLSDGLVKEGEDVAHMPGAIPGTVKLKDVDGYLVDGEGERILDENGKPQYLGSPDGKIDKADLVNIGNNTPISFGFNNSFSYKNFDMNVYVYGMANRLKTNENKTYYEGESFRLKDGTNMPIDIIDRWSYDNQNASVPSIFQANSAYGTGNLYIEDAWFIRLSNITLGYSLPSHIKPKGFEKIRFFASARNLLVISPYSGMDPETGGGVSYPNQRTFTAGVEIKF
ncbi:MAG: TonB-dependent receptor, partial [Bacteroidota bacterium]